MATTPPTTDPQASAISGVGSAFATMPSGLSSTQQTAVAGVQKAFAPASAFSSTAGATALTNATKTAAKLAPVPTTPTTPAAAPTTPTSSTPPSVTMINAKTGQEYTLTNPSSDSIANFKTQGWDVMEGTGDGMGVVEKDPVITAKQSQVDSAKSELDSAKARLSGFNISKDPMMSSIVSSITDQWDSRIQGMLKYNESRSAAMRTTGIRNGMQYTGGAGGMWGGVLSAEETAGMSRIAALEADKQGALTQAMLAYEKQKWGEYSDLVDKAQKSYEDQVTELSSLQKLAQTETENQQKAQYEQIVKPIQDVLSDAAKNGADDKTLAEIANSTDPAHAIAAAGEYLQTGSGMVGEYLFYKRQAEAAGKKPVDFNTYQTIDANRKAKAASAASTLFTPKDQANGAQNAGIAIEDFKGLPVDVQNFYVKAPQKQLDAVNNALRAVMSGHDVVVGKITYSADPAKAKQWIDSSAITQAMKDYLGKRMQTAAPAAGGATADAGGATADAGGATADAGGGGFWTGVEHRLESGWHSVSNFLSL